MDFRAARAIAGAVFFPNGSSIIEKHFTLDRNLPGPDHWFSVNPSNLKKLVDDVKYAYSSRGFGFANERYDIQQKNIMRRRIIFSRKIIWFNIR